MDETRMLGLPNGFVMEMVCLEDGGVTVRLLDASGGLVRMLPEWEWGPSDELADRPPIGSASFWSQSGILLGKYLAQATAIAEASA